MKWIASFLHIYYLSPLLKTQLEVASKLKYL